MHGQGEDIDEGLRWPSCSLQFVAFHLSLLGFAESDSNQNIWHATEL